MYYFLMKRHQKLLRNDPDNIVSGTFKKIYIFQHQDFMMIP